MECVSTEPPRLLFTCLPSHVAVICIILLNNAADCFTYMIRLYTLLHKSIKSLGMFP